MPARPVFRDRTDAGRQLGRFAAEHLSTADRSARPVVLALPHGGVVVGAEVAREIGADLDVVVARKIGAPGDPGLALGAVTSSGPVFWHRWMLRRLALSEEDLAEQAVIERLEARRHLQRYRGGRSLPPMGERTVLVVDDGLATGATAIAALREVRLLRPRPLILAVPVAARDRADAVRDEADELWCLHYPAQFAGIDACYADFPRVTEAQVERILARARAEAYPRSRG